MIICIAGPSSVGKTKLSVELAKKYDAIIINADATQIYQGLDIGSAKVTEDEKQGISHLLFDIRKPDEEYSVSDYQTDGRKLLEEYKDKNIVVVGGTGLYIKSLFYDYKFSKMKDINFDELDNDQLYSLALKKDENCNIHKNNRIRLINFLKKDEFSYDKNKSLYDVIYIGLTMDRKSLYERCNDRVEVMFNDGLLEEVKSLYEKYPDSMILKRAIGYKEVISYLNNEISLSEAKELIKKNTRHYIKRQYTWFNNQMNINWFNVDVNHFDDTINAVYEFINSLNSK